MIGAADLERRLAPLRDIGRDGAGITRLAWSDEAAAASAWFAEQASGAGLRVERDPAGNLWAVPASPPPWWGVGSHLDSVRRGGAYDGALGVVAAFEIATRSAAPLAVLALADEEGARYNTPTFGSRALVGRLDSGPVLGRRDPGGVALGDALAAAGVDPEGLAGTPEWLGRLRGFVELHIDQTRELALADAPVGVVSSLASRLRLRVEIEGRADHAGATARDERRDALLGAARLIVRGDEIAGGEPDARVTVARMLVEPNAPTTVPEAVSLWVDLRAARPKSLDALHARLEGAVREIAGEAGLTVAAEVEARSDGVAFDPGVRRALSAAAAALGPAAPSLVCFAGHDAGVLAERIPAGMVFVRNETGVSHSPAEQVDLEDAALAAEVLLAALGELA